MQSTERIRLDYSDDDIRQRVATFLNSRHFPAFRDLRVNVEHGVVTLEGSVSSFHEKQVALNACQRVAGVLTLVDEINVQALGGEALIEVQALS